ncbi:phage major capsid protein [Mycolicibacterium sp. XJ2]
MEINKLNEKLRRLLAQHADQKAARAMILAGVEARGAKDLTADETRQFKSIVANLLDLEGQITETRDDIARAGLNNPETAAIVRSVAGATRESLGRRIYDALTEARAFVASGSVDIPHLISPNVVDKVRPSTPRLIDLLVNRQALNEGPAYEYFQQTVRTNNAAFVADGDEKPTSVFTIIPKTDRARVIATLTESVPQRLLQDARFVVDWLEREAVGGVLDALEAQVVSGNGLGENLTGLLDDDTALPTQAFTTDEITTIRKSLTKLQKAGEIPNAIVTSPDDAEVLDLVREGTGGVGFLTDGFSNGNANSANVYGSGIARVISNAIPAGIALIGDFSQAKLWVRENIRIDTDFSGDNFTHNTMVLRAEGRFGFGVLRPTAFVVADLTAGT